MTVWHHGNRIYTSTKCTGNRNNLLRIELSDNICETNVLILNSNDLITRQFSEHDVLAQVQLGVHDIFQNFDCVFHIKSVWFVNSDSNPVETYRELTYKILHAILCHQTIHFQAA